MSKILSDVETGKKKRQKIIDIINEKGKGFIQCDFFGNDKESGLSVECWTIDNPSKKIILEIRIAKDIPDLKSGYYKGTRDLNENIKQIQKRIFVLIACSQFSIVPGSKIPLNRFKQSTAKKNETRTNIDMRDFLPYISIHGGNFFDKKNIAEHLYDALMEIK